jgi:hypothetical protein
MAYFCQETGWQRIGLGEKYFLMGLGPEEQWQTLPAHINGSVRFPDVRVLFK